VVEIVAQDKDMMQLIQVLVLVIVVTHMLTPHKFKMDSNVIKIQPQIIKDLLVYAMKVIH